MVRILIVLFAILLLDVGAVFTQEVTTASPSQRHVVEIRDFGFHPQRIFVFPGDTIVWINRDIVPHTATAEDGTWGSKDLEEGDSWEMVVKNGGIQSYFCNFHLQMTAVLEARKQLSGNFSRDKAP